MQEKITILQILPIRILSHHQLRITPGKKVVNKLILEDSNRLIDDLVKLTILNLTTMALKRTQMTTTVIINVEMAVLSLIQITEPLILIKVAKDRHQMQLYHHRML